MLPRRALSRVSGAIKSADKEERFSRRLGGGSCACRYEVLLSSLRERGGMCNVCSVSTWPKSHFYPSFFASFAFLTFFIPPGSLSKHSIAGEIRDKARLG